MADVGVKLDHQAINRLVFGPGAAKECLIVAKEIGRLAYALAPKRAPLHEYAASITEHLEITASGPVAYVSADKDALKVEFGTSPRTHTTLFGKQVPPYEHPGTPRFRPLGKALEAKRIS
ncbi:hypothetical protein [Nonomuraea lactucae]|uniref:hypothetical protein n=1 Tax=Nonomuraea lactucae TaxID=2249762 RepID=UPI000DE50CC6|nr:hypothetical protein [Nonomuraea lactucae]